MKINNQLKSKWSFILVFAVAFLFSFNLGTSKTLAAEAPTRTINITGEGEVIATPDIAYLSLGVVTEGTTVLEAQKANSIAANNVIAAIKNEGISAEDLKTTGYNINPKYDYDNIAQKSILVGYTVSYTLSATIKDIDKVGQVIDVAVENGANISRSISFGVSDYENYYNKALEKALSNADSKAKVISNFMGAQIVTPVKITENSNGVPVDYPVYYPVAMEAKGSYDSATTIQAGTYKIKASVSITYEY